MPRFCLRKTFTLDLGHTLPRKARQQQQKTTAGAFCEVKLDVEKSAYCRTAGGGPLTTHDDLQYSSRRDHERAHSAAQPTSLPTCLRVRSNCSSRPQGQIPCGPAPTTPADAADCPAVIQPWIQCLSVAIDASRRESNRKAVAWCQRSIVGEPSQRHDTDRDDHGDERDDTEVYPVITPHRRRRGELVRSGAVTLQI